MKKFVPVYEGELRKHSIQVPRCISECSGIRIFGRRIKSLVFSTDVAIIKNINADAVIAVYPFTPQPAITQAILSVSEVPVFAGVGWPHQWAEVGQHRRLCRASGAFGLVCNAFITEEAIRAIKETVEIPLVYTWCRAGGRGREAGGGVDFLNVSGAARTPEIVAHIREIFPEVPIIATGGPTDDTIRATIEAGANAITYTPPTSAELFAESMRKYRGKFA
ncbi:MAG: hydrolase [Oscillospiraceae bacterium]